MTSVAPILEHFSPASGSVSAVAAALRTAGYRVCSLEDLDRSTEAPPPTGGTLEEVLDALVAANPGYRWRRSKGGLVEVAPLESVLDESATADDWPSLVAELERHAVTLFQELSGPTPDVQLPADAATVRGLLNAAALGLGPTAAWHVSGTSGAWFLTFVGAEIGRA